ncbi:ATP-binding cassette domain-containing protein [Actinotalea ferrariae]|uniref:ABC transporter ATP-binding protein n=1 Tax=Actinotalea ferrariae TaxID=1386098 RepID=UPI001EC77AC5|nr:ATP-binding cassette domain-containing protein [Actinotalea ferrariae]MBX9244803.1 ATP-binding cassette domain-containing protein [Actinotalea ferrariae]
MQGELTLIDVNRSFGGRPALVDVGFTVRPGRMTGFVGANGAGKTTTMRIVLGVLAADSGRVELGGRELTLDVRRRFGYMPEERGLYPKMTLVDQLVYLGRVHGLDAPTARRRTAELLEQLGLADRARDLLQTLSLGNQQRVQVAAALVHDPVLLVLDEPFSGLDPLAVDAMAAHLRARADAGVPVLFSSHQLELVERVCDDIVIIHRGRVVASGPADQVRAERAGRRMRVVVEPGTDDAGVLPSEPEGAPTGVASFLEQVPGVSLHRQDGRAVVVELAEGADDQALLAEAQRHGRVREFAPVVPTLAEIFREVVR